MNPNVQMMNEVRRLAMQECRDLSREIIGSLLDKDGSTVGDRPLTLGERVERFVDDADSGALDILRAQSNDPGYGRPTIYEQYVRQFVQDMTRAPITQAQAEVARPYVIDVLGGVG